MEKHEVMTGLPIGEAWVDSHASVRWDKIRKITFSVAKWSP